ncbi:reverse transcriptase domain, reverse transcriptase zinc-binding domain protein, partial [Tanacetum coccineum]
STLGCDAEQDYQPPCPNNIVDASKAVWKALGVSENNWGDLDITIDSIIRPRGSKVDWCDVVWFSCCIPRHAVHLWLVIRRRLKTQDNLRYWDNAGSLNMACSLCESQPDSHEHLFFECAFSQQVWSHLKGFAGLPNTTLSINEIINDILPFAARKTSKSIIAKLVLAAATYFIWQERNGRLFKNSKRTVNQVIEYIMNSVRLKLLSCRLKKTRSALDLVKAWNLSEAICS